MVVSAHPLASAAGVRILKAGGNAWDAAVAVQFTLAVVLPVAGNIGGGGFAVYRQSGGECGSLDFREKAPSGATRDMYLDGNGDLKETASLAGHLASGVPGSVDGMVSLHKRFGTLSWAELLEPAIELAQEGFGLTEEGAAGINSAQDLFKSVNNHDFVYIRDTPWRKGDVLIQEDLAETLRRIKYEGRNGFYDGITARLLVEEMKSGGGIITLEDLRAYQSQWRDPVVGTYKSHRIISMPPPSSGGIALIQLLKSVEEYPFSRFGHNSWKALHLMTEVEKRVYADRATYLGDPDFVDVPQKMLLNDIYLGNRMSKISMKRSTPSTDIKKGHVDAVESVQTTHFSIVDGQGNAVSITTTLNSYFGSKVMVRGAGFFLNNEMDDFSVKAGVPNQFGLLGGVANEIVPGKRMLSSMTPTIVEKDNKLLMVVGTPGGSTIITSVFQTILNVIDHHMGMQDAVDASRLHHQWLPDRILMEDQAIDRKVKDQLVRKGHSFEERGKIGRVDAILVLPDGRLEGGADHRGDDKAIGF
ncbi:UNVERIFIED_CONTAM: hypothetical protein GTU68_043907 [Idotea baltica]|nr:hypothetical protein [Idotea baltica]